MTTISVGATKPDVQAIERRQVEVKIGRGNGGGIAVERLTYAEAGELVAKLAAYLTAAPETAQSGFGSTVGSELAVDVVTATLGQAIGVDPEMMRREAELAVGALLLTRPDQRVIVPKHSPQGVAELTTYTQESPQFTCLGCGEKFATEGEARVHIVARDAIAAGPLTQAEFERLPVGSIVTVEDYHGSQDAAILSATNGDPVWFTTLDAPSNLGYGNTTSRMWSYYGEADDGDDVPGIRLVRYGTQAAL